MKYKIGEIVEINSPTSLSHGKKVQIVDYLPRSKTYEVKSIIKEVSVPMFIVECCLISIVTQDKSCKIKLNFNGNTTIAKIGDKLGIAVCKEEDTYNKVEGIKIAISRALGINEEEIFKETKKTNLNKEHILKTLSTKALLDELESRIK